jgi:hypothetical protein
MSVLLVFFDNLTNTTVDAKVLKAVLVKTKWHEKVRIINAFSSGWWEEACHHLLYWRERNFQNENFLQVHSPLSTILKSKKLWKLEVLTHTTHDADVKYQSTVLLFIAFIYPTECEYSCISLQQ